jgi:hypothetical protein
MPCNAEPHEYRGFRNGGNEGVYIVAAPTHYPPAVDRFFRPPVISKFETGEDPLNCYCQPGLIDL